MTQFTPAQVLDAFKNRDSIRYYDNTRKISDEDFNFILELGRLSPSSVGSEPWKFLVIQNKELREKIKPFSWGMANQLDDCSHVVVFLAKKNARYDSEFMRDVIVRKGFTTEEEIQGVMARYRGFQENDMKSLESERALFDWASKQTYIALANMMTGAAMAGIDSCPIEGFNYEQMNQALAETGAFDPKEYGVSVAVTFGYRAKAVQKKGRKPKEDVVVWLK